MSDPGMRDEPTAEQGSDRARTPTEGRPDTLAVRAGLARSGFDETAEALYLTSGYVYATAEEAADAFAGRTARHRYSRVTNPTITMLQDRAAALEGAEACWATASGMAAVFNALLACTRQGDRIVASRDLFGSCTQILTSILPRYGITTTFVDGTDLDQWEAALREPAAVAFFESPSNPMQTLVDVAAVSRMAHEAGATVVVDNVFASSVFQQPLALGADVVVYSTTKHMDGQGRTLGGLVLGSQQFIGEQLQPFMRHTGPAMSPFTAWVVLKGLETQRLRVQHAHATAVELGGWLEQQDGISWVRFPWLASHPQHALAREQMSGGGTVLTFEVQGGTPAAFHLLNALRIIDISNNLADTKSLATHPATTTHHSIGPEARAAAGISDGVIRLSIGLEDVEDLREDLGRGLTALRT